MKIQLDFEEFLVLKDELRGRCEVLANSAVDKPDPWALDRVRHLARVLQKLEASRRVNA